MKSWLTPAYKSGNQKIAVMQDGYLFLIMKLNINYISGKNIESWRVMGSASRFESLSDCMGKFGRLVNSSRKKDGKKEINFIVEN